MICFRCCEDANLKQTITDEVKLSYSIHRLARLLWITLVKLHFISGSLSVSLFTTGNKLSSVLHFNSEQTCQMGDDWMSGVSASRVPAGVIWAPGFSTSRLKTMTSKCCSTLPGQYNFRPIVSNWNCNHLIVGWLLEFYVLAISRFIFERVLSYDSVH